MMMVMMMKKTAQNMKKVVKDDLNDEQTNILKKRIAKYKSKT